jgi:vesicle-associated membrane protein 4
MSVSSPHDAKLAALQKKVAEVTPMMAANLKLSVARGDHLVDMEGQAERLNGHADSFRNGTKRVRRLMCCRSYRMLGLIVLGIVVLLLIIIVPSALAAKK